MIALETNPTQYSYDLYSDNHSGQAIYPSCKLTDRYMAFARKSCESEDNLLLGSFLSVIAAKLGRSVWFDFGAKLYPNIYTMLAAKAGFRKSTCVRLAEKIAQRIMPKERFLSSQASEEALFYEYDSENGGCCDKYLIEDEGNTVLNNWANSQYGKNVSKRFLSLFDCKRWTQSFKQNLKDGDSVMREIPETSTSMLLASTLGSAGFNGIESKDGMQRRFLTYLSENLIRTIYRPPSMNSSELEELCMDLSTLDRLSGEIKFDPDADDEWIRIQDRNRKDISECSNSHAREEMVASILATEPTHTLKIAMIFACLRAVDEGSSKPSISAENLQYANLHVRQCIRDAMALEGVSQRSGIREDGERIYASILASPQSNDIMNDELGRFIKMSKSQITSRFANDTRRGGMTVDRLYHKIIPYLIKQKKCIELENTGKKRVYGFLCED